MLRYSDIYDMGSDGRVFVKSRLNNCVGAINGEVVLNKGLLEGGILDSICEMLILRKRAFRPDEESRDIEFFREDRDSLYIPRSIGRQVIREVGLPLSDETTEGERYPFKFLGKLRVEQESALDAIMRAFKSEEHGGVLKAPCGAGKTTTCLAAIAKLGVKCVVLLHKDALIEQWRNRIEQFLGITDVGIVKAKKAEWDAPIVLASIQTIIRRNIPRDIVDQFGLLIADETHHIPSEKWVSSLFPFHCRYRLGLSATPRRGDGLAPMIFWGMGPIITEMEGPKVSAQVYALINDLMLPDWVFFKEYDKFNRGAFTSWVSKLKWRNALAAEYITQALESNRKVLVLSDRINQLLNILKIIRNKKHESNIVLYTSKDKTGSLQDAINAQLLLTTYGMLSEGFDVPSMDTLFLLTPRSDVEQSVGRVMRSCAEKKEPVVFDIIDLDAEDYLPDGSNDSDLARMSKMRLSWYKEKGYKIKYIDRRKRSL